MNKEYLLKLAKADLGNAHDNLYRAKCAARGCDPTKQWGQSGQTLNDIIAEYQKWADEAQSAVDSMERA